jgi:hypothetical protein
VRPAGGRSSAIRAVTNSSDGAEYPGATAKEVLKAQDHVGKLVDAPRALLLL